MKPALLNRIVEIRGSRLRELIRRGARKLIQNAIEVEVRKLMAEHDNVRTLTGMAAVVCNGFPPAEVRVHEVRDRSRRFGG